MAQLDQEIVRVTALQVVFGLLLTFGLEAFKVNTAVPELEHDEPSTTGEEQDKSSNEDNENKECDEDNENSDNDNVEESQAPDTDTAASVLTILTGILESEVSSNSCEISYFYFYFFPALSIFRSIPLSILLFSHAVLTNFFFILQSNDLRNVAAEGLAKLLLAGRVLSAKLFSRLLLLWYNPTTEDDVNLRHCLGVFFPVFAFASRYVCFIF